MLQKGWARESDFLQNDLRNRAYMGLEASHFIEGTCQRGSAGHLYGFKKTATTTATVV